MLFQHQLPLSINPKSTTLSPLHILLAPGYFLLSFRMQALSGVGLVLSICSTAVAGPQRRDYGAWSKVMTVRGVVECSRVFKIDSRTRCVRNWLKGMRETEEPRRLSDSQLKSLKRWKCYLLVMVKGKSVLEVWCLYVEGGSGLRIPFWIYYASSVCKTLK